MSETHPAPVAAAYAHDVPRDGRSCFTRVAGRQVHYLEWGPAAAPVVLALHGGGQTSYMYEDLGRALRGSRHVIAPDLPHHGESEGLPAPTDFGRGPLAASLVPLIDDLGIEQMSIVGASLGGILALTYAARHPERVRRIALIDVGHRLEEAGVRRIIDFLQRHESFGSLEEAATAISEYLPNRPASNPQRLRRNLRQRPDGRWVWKHDLGRISSQRMNDVNWDEILEGLSNDAAKIQVPVLVLRGASSDVLSKDGASEIADVLPNGRVVEVGGAGHLAAGDNPATTVNVIRGFLDEADPTS